MNKLFLTSLFALLLQYVSAQQWNTFGGNNITTGEYLGGDGTSTIPLRLKTITSYSIDFYTGNTQYMTLTSAGLLGIGAAPFTPTYKLDIDAGDVNINSPRNGYRLVSTSLGSQFVLWNNDIPDNIYVGVNAGNNHSTLYNTFVGYNAGFNNGFTLSGNSGGYKNSFVGHSAGAANDEGFQNTFVGYSAGVANDTGFQNAFLGAGAGFSNTRGYHNTFIGFNAGYSNVDANSSVYVGTDAGYSNNSQYNVMIGRNAGRYSLEGKNCYYGKDAGYYDIYGSGNCFYGFHSGANITNAPDYTTTSNNAFFGYRTGHIIEQANYNCVFGGDAGLNFQRGDSNIFIGGKAQPNAILVNNSVAFGFEAQVNDDNMFILGNNLQNVGIGLSDDLTFNGPRSKLEINSDASSAVSGLTGSGLQFRQLFSTSTLNDSTYVAPYGLVLTVDQDGIVKLTEGGGISFAECGASAPILTSDISMQLNDNTIYYDGNNTTTGTSGDVPNSIGLGYACGDPLKGKLSVYQKATLNDGEETTAGYFHNESEDVTGAALNFKRGIWAISNGFSGAQNNIGGDFSADSSLTGNIAVRGIVGAQVNDLSPSFHSGGQFIADNAFQNYGVEAYVWGNGTFNYGISACAPAGVCTTGGPCVNAAGYFNGNTFTISQNFLSSDIILKYDIQPLSDPLTIIKALEPKSYYFRKAEYPYLSLPDGKQQGLIAQDVERILPNLVKSFGVPSRPTMSGGRDTVGAGTLIKSIDYSGIIPYLIGAIKQQQESIDSLRNQIIEAQSQIENCCRSKERSNGINDSGNVHNESHSDIDVELSDAKTIILDQNSPNPFSEETYISYVIPDTVSKAVIVIYDNVGQVLKTVVINERGEGVLHIFAEKLSSGIYTYSLVADGKTIDSKKMVCNK